MIAGVDQADNVKAADQDLGNIVSIGNGVLIRPSWPSVGWNLSVDSDKDDVFNQSSPAYRIISPVSGIDGGKLQIKGTATGTAGGKKKFCPRTSSRRVFPRQ